MNGRFINQINGKNINQTNRTDINIIYGTQGDDKIIEKTDDQDHIDVGEVIEKLTDGRDHIYAQEGADTIVGSLGGDTIDFGYDDDRDQVVYRNFSQRGDRITNFDPNEDIVVITSDFFSDLVNDKGLNPDANVGDWLKIDQFGADTKIQVDPDGLEGNSPFRTLVTLKDVNANDLDINIVDNNFIIG